MKSSGFLFSQATPIVRQSQTRVIAEADLPELPGEISAFFISDLPHLEKKPSNFDLLKLVARIVHLTGSSLKYSYGSLLLAIVLDLIFPTYLANWSEALRRGELPYVLSALLPLLSLLSGISMQYYFYFSLLANQKITKLVSHWIYQRSLRISIRTRSEKPIGDLVSIMGSDVETVSDLPLLIGDWGWNFLVIGLVGILLFKEIGIIALYAYLFLGLTIPLTSRLSKGMNKTLERALERRDFRLTLLSQAIQAIRMIKSFNWETPLSKQLGQIRDQEITARKRNLLLPLLSSMLYLTAHAGALALVLYFLQIRGISWNLSLALKIIAYFAIIEDPIVHIPSLLARYSQMVTATKRLYSFLALEPLSSSTELPAPPSKTNQSAQMGLSLELSNLRIRYSSESEIQPALQINSLILHEKQSLALVGSVGSGKSSLIRALLNELPESKGSLLKSAEWNKVGYVPQTPVLMSGTIIENLSMGSFELPANNESHSERLKRALADAGLPLFEKNTSESRLFPNGLFTEIGERGINLSGGQKQRIALARAALYEPNVLLLDDCLSAVDPTTETHILNLLIFGRWKHKTRIVATHRLGSLQLFDQVAFFEKGLCLGQGTFLELYKALPAFKRFVDTETQKQKDSDSTLDLANLGSNPKLKPVSQNQAPPQSPEYILKEFKEEGQIKRKIYNLYFSYLGPKTLIFLLFLCVAHTVLPLYQKQILMSFSNETTSLFTLIPFYLGLSIASLLLLSLQDGLWWFKGLGAGRKLHNDMTESLLNARLSFFDRTPVGRILQRFSRDLEATDLQIHQGFSSFANCIVPVAMTVILVTWIYPPILLALIPIFFVYFRIQNQYRVPAREVKRMDSLARSPRYVHFKESIESIEVIRAQKAQAWAFEYFSRLLNHSQRMFYGHYLINRWFSSRIPILGAGISLVTLFGFAWASHTHTLQPELCAVVALYALGLWKSLNWAIRIFADVESKLTSLERVNEYRSLESEHRLGSTLKPFFQPFSVESKDVALQIKDLWVRYSKELPWVLRNFNMSVRSGEKVGIIGKTGSGKSTLFQVLLGFLPNEQGEIYLGSRPYSGLDLRDIRRSIAWVPQDPQLFLGSLRSNLDRFENFSDSELLNALEQVGLGEWVKSLPSGLDTETGENGSNLSQGQRQLFCFARMLLLKPKIVLLDEATANVDVVSDQRIQDLLQTQFKGVTLITIAHRIDTLKNYDRIVDFEK